jgi:hypothetical protein
MNDNGNPNRPVQVWKHKGIDVSLWNSRHGGYNIKIVKRWMDDQTQQWKDTNYYTLRDLPFLISILNEVLTAASPNPTATPNPMENNEWTKKNTIDPDVDDIPF